MLNAGELPKFLGSGLLKCAHIDGSDSLLPWAVIYWHLKCKVGVSERRVLILGGFSLNGARVCEPAPTALGAAGGFSRLWRALGMAVQGERHGMVSKTAPKASTC